jgi:hypothetical protein
MIGNQGIKKLPNFTEIKVITVSTSALQCHLILSHLNQVHILNPSYQRTVVILSFAYSYISQYL